MNLLDKLYLFKKRTQSDNYNRRRNKTNISIGVSVLVLFIILFLYQDFRSKERLKNYKIDFNYSDIQSMEVIFLVIKDKTVNIKREIDSSNWQKIYGFLIKASSTNEYFGIAPRNDINQGRLTVTIKNGAKQEYLVGLNQGTIKYVYLTQTKGNTTHYLKTVKSEKLYDLIFEHY